MAAQENHAGSDVCSYIYNAIHSEKESSYTLRKKKKKKPTSRIG